MQMKWKIMLFPMRSGFDDQSQVNKMYCSWANIRDMTTPSFIIYDKNAKNWGTLYGNHQGNNSKHLYGVDWVRHYSKDFICINSFGPEANLWNRNYDYYLYFTGEVFEVAMNISNFTAW